MRAGLAAIAVLALCVTPVAAQGKTKPGAVPQSVAALEMCETFAAGDVLAVEAAIEKGWDAYDDGGESPYVRSYSGSKDLPGIGYATMFALIESYPNLTFGYCRVDVSDVTGNADGQVQAIQNLDRYEGESIQNGDGIFASLAGTDDKNRLLLTHLAQNTFVIQLSIITPKAETAD
ncbi:hypothetical protein [Devosia ginsengisoli]|uniref:Uncharacterized protein n=1 Tax=Devosia ginsengisoli TaxID=400770 RepID=A0A5B8LUA8_9HYPH|nr:hypothetical protein [Devosia ginsengisoli]QDZ11234.1 hypothetical protein FPZ08_10965 [Devosia ginsengisoli]